MLPTTKAPWPAALVSSRTARATLLGVVACGTLMLAVACGSRQGGTTSTPIPDASPNASAPGGGPGSLPRTPPPRLKFPLDSRRPGAVRVARAFPNLTFANPTCLTYAPDGSNRVFVASRDGQIYVFPNTDTVTSASLFLDLSARVHSMWEEGLLGLAFDPDYATNGFFYVNYTERTRYDTMVARFKVSATNPNQADPQSEFLLMRVDQPEGNHNGGMLAFGPDRMLYLSLGDGGGQGDPYNNGQNLGSVFAKILRIDPRTPSGTNNYTIPSDNPFFGQAGKRGETWAYGLRNPWRFSFDRQTGDLWSCDVGQDRFEEVDLIRRGGNYGWPVYEGTTSYRNPNNRPITDFDAPVHVLARNEASSIIGGYVYRGNAMASMQGAYVYGDFQSGNVFALRASNGQLISNQTVGYLPQISSFGEDAGGEIYVLSLSNGQVHRLTEQGGGGSGHGVPDLLSATGLLADPIALRWAHGVMPYDVNVPLWSDGAKKTRFFVVPDDYIDFHATDAWTFPLGTVLVKHFEIALFEGDPHTTHRLETRVFVNERAGWAGYTYRWNEAQTDAELLTTGASEILTIRDIQGRPRQQTWDYPSRTDCLQCHTAPVGYVLGLRTEQVTRKTNYGGQVLNQLDVWNRMNYFRGPVGAGSTYSSLPDLHDESASKIARARAYMAANCANCHRPGGAMGGDIDLRYQTSDANLNVINVRPLRGGLGLPDAYRVKRNAIGSSVLFERMQRLDGTRMPQLGSHVVDPDGIALIRGWIESLR